MAEMAPASIVRVELQENVGVPHWQKYGHLTFSGICWKPISATLSMLSRCVVLEWHFLKDNQIYRYALNFRNVVACPNGQPPEPGRVVQHAALICAAVLLRVCAGIVICPGLRHNHSIHPHLDYCTPSTALHDISVLGNGNFNFIGNFGLLAQSLFPGYADQKQVHLAVLQGQYWAEAHHNNADDDWEHLKAAHPDPQPPVRSSHAGTHSPLPLTRCHRVFLSNGGNELTLQ
jgi:hypothetical protein